MASPVTVRRCLSPLLALAALALAACHESAPPAEACTEGTEGCPCAGGRFCDPGLACEAG